MTNICNTPCFIHFLIIKKISLVWETLDDKPTIFEHMWLISEESAKAFLLLRRWRYRDLISSHLSKHKTSGTFIKISIWMHGKAKTNPLNLLWRCITESVRLALPAVLLARQWINSWGPCCTRRIPMVSVPCVFMSVLSRILPESKNCTRLGELDSTIHTHVISFAPEVQWDALLISGATATDKKTFLYLSLARLTALAYLQMTSRSEVASCCCPPLYVTLQRKCLLLSSLVAWNLRIDTAFHWPPLSGVCWTFCNPGWFQVKTGGDVGQEWVTKHTAKVDQSSLTCPVTDKEIGSGSPAASRKSMVIQCTFRSKYQHSVWGLTDH